MWVKDNLFLDNLHFPIKVVLGITVPVVSVSSGMNNTYYLLECVFSFQITVPFQYMWLDDVSFVRCTCVVHL